MPKKKTDKEILDRLPGDLREVAELIGLEDTWKLVDRWGGTYINVPKCDELRLEAQVAEAQELYDAGGVTIRDLALRFGKSDRQMKRWLKLDVEEVPLPLLELMNKEAS